jgi:hypothetical protein
MSVARNRMTNDDAMRVSPRRLVLDTTFRNVGVFNVPVTHGTLEAVGGTVTVDTTPCAAVLAVTSTSASRALMQTHEAFRGGLGSHALMHSDAGATNQKRRHGRFDSASGYFFERDGTTLYAVRRSSVSGLVVDTRVASIAWSDDNADGTGGLITLDVTLPHRYAVEVPQDGAGPARFYIDGVLCHVFDGTTDLLSDTCVLPSAVEVVNTGTASVGSLVVLAETVAVDEPELAVGYSVPFVAFTPSASPGRTLVLRPRSLTPVNRGVLLARELRLYASVEVVVNVRLGPSVGGSYTTPYGSIGETTETTEDFTANTSAATFVVPAGAERVIDLRQIAGRLRVVEYLGGAVFASLPELQIEVIGTSGTCRGFLTWDEVQP